MYLHVFRDNLHKHASAHAVFSRVMVVDDRPGASAPSKAASASTKSPVKMPFR